MWSVMRFYHLLKAGNSWKLNQNIIELWQSSYDSDETSTTISLCPDEFDSKSVQEPYDEDVSKDPESDDCKIVGDGEEEDETLLVICDEI